MTIEEFEALVSGEKRCFLSGLCCPLAAPTARYRRNDDQGEGWMINDMDLVDPLPSPKIIGHLGLPMSYAVGVSHGWDRAYGDFSESAQEAYIQLYAKPWDEELFERGKAFGIKCHEFYLENKADR